MIPAPFAYRRVSSVEEAVRVLKESGGEAKLLAGGHSLLPMMKLRISTPEQLIDIDRIQELKGIRLEKDRLVVGALTTHAQVARNVEVRRHLPLLAEAASVIGDLQVRNRGTVGGNLAHADPASDLPAVVLALEAEFRIVGPSGQRSLAADDFFIGPLVTALGGDEILTEIAFPLPRGRVGSAYEKFAHPASGYAVVGVAAVIGLDDSGAVNLVRVGITGAGDAVYRARAVEHVLQGKKPDEQTLHEAAARAAHDGVMAGDLFASQEYRRHLCQVYALRALKRALPGGG